MCNNIKCQFRANQCVSARISIITRQTNCQTFNQINQFHSVFVTHNRNLLSQLCNKVRHFHLTLYFETQNNFSLEIERNKLEISNPNYKLRISQKM